MPVLQPSYKSPLEKTVAAQLKAAKIAPNYEERVLEFEVPARTAKYKPDFPIGNIIIECKGFFGGTGPGASYEKAVEVRQKMLLMKQQHPDLDVRFVFEDENKTITKTSSTTYANWAEHHGFKWARKKLPPEWIKELKEEHDRIEAQAKRPPHSRSPGKARQH